MARWGGPSIREIFTKMVFYEFQSISIILNWFYEHGHLFGCNKSVLKCFYMVVIISKFQKNFHKFYKVIFPLVIFPVLWSCKSGFITSKKTLSYLFYLIKSKFILTEVELWFSWSELLTEIWGNNIKFWIIFEVGKLMIIE